MLSLKIDSSQADRYAQKMWGHLQKQLNRVISSKGLGNTKKRKAIGLSDNEIKFLSSINTEQKLKEILSSIPSKLRGFIFEFEQKNPAIRMKTIENI